jgi:hypothetical protein
VSTSKTCWDLHYNHLVSDAVERRDLDADWTSRG